MVQNGLLSIPEFYRGKGIFITGGTGFIGKVLIEKLLRSCPDLGNIYILIRPKKNKNVKERLEILLNNILFDTLRKSNSSVLQKIIPIAGDTEKINLGISNEDRKILINNVSIVFHVAASVRFDDFLQKAIITNVRCTNEVINLLEDLKHVDVFVHVSTAYSNCRYRVIEEKLYPAEHSWKEAIDIAENCTDNSIEILCLKYLDRSPNTYTFTKALAEQLVYERCKNRFPTLIARPSIVIPTVSEPVIGFTDNFNGPVSLYVATGKGVNRFVLADCKVEQNQVFVDNVVKSLIIASWKEALHSDHLNTINFYNLASDLNFTPNFVSENLVSILENPTETYFWVPSFNVISCWYQYFIYFIIYQIIPALVVDGLLKIVRGKQRLLYLTRKIFIVNNALQSFTRNNWEIKCDNYVGLENSLKENDLKSFSFVHNRYKHSKEVLRVLIEIASYGKLYLLKERVFSSDAEKLRLKRMYLLNDVLKIVLKLLVLYIIFWRYNALEVIYTWIFEYFVNVDKF